MALRGGTTIDVTLKSISQMSPVTSALQGELQSATNAVVTRFKKGEVEALKIGKRGGWSPITSEVRSPVDGSVIDNGGSSPSVMKFPNLMASLADSQLLIESAAKPYVWAENRAWEQFPYTMPTNTIRQKVVFIDNHEMTIPDGATSAGVNCYVWSRFESGVPGKCYAAFYDASDGTPIRLPFEIGTPGHKIKVVGSPNTGKFFIFTDDGTTAKVHVFDRDGILFIESTNQLATTRPWDVICDDTQGVNWVTSDGTHAKVVGMVTGAGPSITMTPRTFATTKASLAAVFMTNEVTGDGLLYVATINDEQLDIEGIGHFGEQIVYAYQIPPTGTAVSRNWDSITGISNTRPYIPGTPKKVISNIAGYVTATGSFELYTSAVQLGSPLDSTTLINRGHPDGSNDNRNSLSGVSVASRAFTIGDLATGATPAVVMYYASVPTLRGNGQTSVGQPTYFILDMASGRDQVIGRFDYGGAAMDYTPFGADFPQTSNGNNLVGMYLLHAPSPFNPIGDVHLPLGFIGESVNVVLGGNRASTLDTSVVKTRSTVGLKDTIVLQKHGKAVDYASELFLPGPIATVFTGSSFSESGINLAPEQPTFTYSGGGFVGQGKRGYIVVFEWTTPTGDRAQSQPSSVAFATVPGAGTNTVHLTGHTISMTTRTDIVISIYRDFFEGGVISQAHRKVTDDLNPLYNDPNQSTWTFTDSLSEAACAVNEPLYSDLDSSGRGELFHDPAPPFSSGCVAGDRLLLMGYDNAVWFSAPKTQGKSLWFNADAWRIPLPTSDPGVAISIMDNRAIIQCEHSLWFIPLGQFPDATGQGGSLPAPQRLPFSNGSTGFTLATREGLMYSSSSGQLWTIVRDLSNAHTGSPVVDELSGRTVNGMVVDIDQRVYVPLSDFDGGTFVLVYDVIAQCWTKFQMPTAPRVSITFRGSFMYADRFGIIWAPNGTKADTAFDGSGHVVLTQAIITNIKILPVHIGGVKNWKRTWDCQLFGTYKDDHDLHVRVTFDDNPVSTIVPFDFTPDPAVPYLYDIPPTIETASSMAFEIFDSFPRGNPGDSFELEMLSFYVAMEKGLNKWPAAIRIPSGVVTYLVVGGGNGNLNMITVKVPGLPSILATTPIPGFITGKALAYVETNDHFYTLRDTVTASVDGVDVISSSDGRFWVII